MNIVTALMVGIFRFILFIPALIIIMFLAMIYELSGKNDEIEKAIEWIDQVFLGEFL